MKIKLLEPIEGFEDTAEIRPVERKDIDGVKFGIAMRRIEIINAGDVGYNAIILTRTKQWQTATMQDVVDVLSGRIVLARFRDNRTVQWEQYNLRGAYYTTDGKLLWLTEHLSTYRYCEVLR